MFYHGYHNRRGDLSVAPQASLVHDTFYCCSPSDRERRFGHFSYTWRKVGYFGDLHDASDRGPFTRHHNIRKEALFGRTRVTDSPAFPLFRNLGSGNLDAAVSGAFFDQLFGTC